MTANLGGELGKDIFNLHFNILTNEERDNITYFRFHVHMPTP